MQLLHFQRFSFAGADDWLGTEQDFEQWLAVQTEEYLNFGFAAASAATTIPIAFHVLWNGRLLRIAPFILIALALGLLSGCASTTLEVYPPVGAEPLGPDEGLLILHIETEVPLASISLPWALAVSDLPKGRHLWIVRARAGTYRWKNLRLAREVGSEGYLNLDDYRVMRRVKNWVWDDEFRFDVEAGQQDLQALLVST